MISIEAPKPFLVLSKADCRKETLYVPVSACTIKGTIGKFFEFREPMAPNLHLRKWLAPK
jgi:hypothetical protein